MKKGLAQRICEHLYPTGLGYDNKELAEMFLGRSDSNAQNAVRQAFQQIRKYGFRVVKRMYAVDGKVQLCKYHIVEGVAEHLDVRVGRPPHSCLQ
jgi:hypothetical protein